MKLPSTDLQSEDHYFEDMPYPASMLGAFVFNHPTGEFVIALKAGDGAFRYKTNQKEAFVQWLRDHDVDDVLAPRLV